MSRIRVKTIIFSREELETHLIEKLHFPEDIVVTGIAKPVNQEAYVITIQSAEFPEFPSDLSLAETSRKDHLFN